MAYPPRTYRPPVQEQQVRLLQRELSAIADLVEAGADRAEVAARCRAAASKEWMLAQVVAEGEARRARIAGR